MTGKPRTQSMTQYACHGVVWWCLLRSFPPYPLLGDGSLRKQKYPRLTSDARCLVKLLPILIQTLRAQYGAHSASFKERGRPRLGVDISVCARNRLQEGGTAESCVRDTTRLLHGRHTASWIASSVSLSFPPLSHNSHRFSTDDCRKSMQFRFLLLCRASNI